MDNDTTIVPTMDEGKFIPEPIPDNIADTEINGLEPVPADEVAPVEEVNDDTSEDEPAPVETPEEPAEAEEPEPTEEPVAPTTEEQQQTELTGAERRLAEKAQRDYIAEERQKIREYEQTNDLSDVEERMKVLEAKQYVDTVERNRQTIANDVTRAQNDIPFFKSGTEQSQLLFNQSLENFANAYGVIDPQSGEWIAAQDRNGNDVPLLPYLQQQAAIYDQAIQNATATATRDASKSEARMRAKAVNPSNPGKVTSTGDELQDLLDKIGDVQIA